eukprot:Sspe_Gene.77512::Locus_48444_Transcript_1_1_Confidence_1.000_Length_1400::g.77512::m.77512
MLRASLAASLSEVSVVYPEVLFRMSAWLLGQVGGKRRGEERRGLHSEETQLQIQLVEGGGSNHPFGSGHPVPACSTPSNRSSVPGRGGEEKHRVPFLRRTAQPQLQRRHTP